MAAAEPAPVEPEAPQLVELALASVELSPEGLLPATGKVTLVDREGGGRLDIVMARPDAVLVQEALAGTTPPRPRTHDLLIEAIAALSGAVTGVTLVERRPGGVYVATLSVLRPNGSVAELDARPSDALNVALRSRGAALRADRSLIEVPAN
ncbi:MAG: bifunctional nuclease domain-containing protein [Acidimicrobiales bacterium]